MTENEPVNGSPAAAPAALEPKPKTQAELILEAAVQEFAEELATEVRNSGGNIDGFQLYLQQRLQYTHMMALTQEMAAIDPTFDERICGRMTQALRDSTAELKAAAKNPKIAIAVADTLRGKRRQ